MDWKCSCKTLNIDNLEKCSNCGRAKPKYFGMKIQFTPNQQFDNKKLSIWYLQIALKYLDSATENINKLEQSKNEHTHIAKVPDNIISFWEKLKINILSNCENCFSMLEESEKLDPTAVFENEDGINVNSNSIKSDCHYFLGCLYFAINSFENAVINFQKSFDLDPNQFSIYKIALSTIKLPVEGKSLFSGKKTNQAIENKTQQEIDLLKLTIKFSPFSELGKLSAQILKEKYNYCIKLSDLN